MITSLNQPRNGYRYRILSYMRVSKDDDLTGSFTFETQRQRIREKLDQRYGEGRYEVTEHIDDGVSGSYGPEASGIEKRTRKSLIEVIANINTGHYDGLVVYDLSRFARSPRWFYQLLEDVILPSGCDFISACEDLDFSKTESRVMAGLLSVMNGFYRDAGVKRCKDATATRAQQGYIVGSTGYGWMPEPMQQVPERGRRGIVRVEDQGRWVIAIKDYYLAGWGTCRIAGELNALGVPSPTGKSRWRSDVVQNVLQNPTHAGLVRYNAKLFPGAHLALRYYDEDVFAQIHEAKARRYRWHPSKKEVTLHLLRGLLICNRCGHGLYTSRVAKNYRAYRCQNGTQQGQRTCPRMAVNAEALERAVERELALISQEPEMQRLLLEEAELLVGQEDLRLDSECAPLEKKLAEIEAQGLRWADAYSRNILTEEQFVAFNQALLKDKAETRTRLDQIKTKLQQRDRRTNELCRLRKILLDFPQMWQHLDMDERRNVLQLLCEKMTVDRDKNEIVLKLEVVFLPEREVRILIPTGYRTKPEGIGPHTLTARHLALLYHLGMGKSVAEASELMGITLGTAQGYQSPIRRRMGVYDLHECARLARQRINTLLPSLPVGRLRGKATQTLTLTEKQQEIFPLLASGAQPLDVARLTGLSVSTVVGRRKQILRLLGVKRIYEAVAKARELGLLS